MKLHWLSVLLLVPMASLSADDWPQWMGPKRDSVWKETGLIEKFPEKGPNVLWRTPISGGFAGPAVAGGKVFVTDFVAKEGENTSNFGARDKRKGSERLLCLDATTGKELWKHEDTVEYGISYSSGPRCTPTVDGEVVYTLGAEGNLNCLSVADGKVLWAKELKKEYKMETPLWGFCGHPLVDGNKLFCLVGGTESVAVAFDKKTGKELWKGLTAKEPGYCPPSMIEFGGTKQLLIWHSQAINSLDPETGKVYWSVPLEPSYGMSITVPRLEGDLLYVSGIGYKAVVLKLAKDKPAAEILWKGTKENAVYCSEPTPFIENGTIYGCDCHDGAFRAVDLKTGERLWEDYRPTTGKKRGPHGTAFGVKNGDRFVLFSETGDLIFAKLSPKGYDEVSRANLLKPTGTTFGRDYVWVHPAFANKCVFVRNDKEIICVSLEK